MKGRALVPGRADEKDIARLMDEHAGALLGVCRAILGDWALAQDIVQETFVKAWRMGGAPGENERAWLIRVAVNACRDELRGRWLRHTDRRVTPEDLPLAAPEAEDGGVMDEVKRLPEKEREMIVMFYNRRFAGPQPVAGLPAARPRAKAFEAGYGRRFGFG